MLFVNTKSYKDFVAMYKYYWDGVTLQAENRRHRRQRGGNDCRDPKQ